MKLPQKRLPILHKLVYKSNNLLRISILLIKRKKPMIPKLIFIKKSRKLKFLKYYNYGFFGEYQFDSPSSNSPIHYYNRKHELNSGSIHDIYSMLLWCKSCFGCSKGLVIGEEDGRLALEADLAAALIGGELDLEEDQEDSVDERAERFIQWFYTEMRLQRQESF